MAIVIYVCKCGRQSKRRKCCKCTNATRRLKQKENFKVGLCRCGGVREYNKSKCIKCLIKQRKHRSSLRLSRARLNKCTICSKPAKLGNRHCIRHLSLKSSKINSDYIKIKLAVFAYYGTYCVCCGEQNIDFLTIDHITNDGGYHRRKVGNGLYRWLVKNNFPAGFQVLCMQCNSSKSRHGQCIHQYLNHTRCIICTNPIINGNCKCSVVTDLKSLRLYYNQKKICFKHYGLECRCCGQNEFLFLTIDHISNDGNIHRKTMKSLTIYRWLIKNNLPDGFQTLCMQCNFAKGKLKVCPHQW